MEHLQRIYRLLVLVSLGMYLVWTFFRNIYWSNFDENIQKLLSVDGYGSIVPYPEYLFIVLLIVSFFCYFGLYFFKKWAVWLLILLNVVVLVVLAPFAGIEVAAPVERVSKAILLIADGAIIALVFLSDLKVKFN